MANLCIDLCSGLGGFSQAFVDAGWDVVRIDIDRKFRPTIQADAGMLPLKDGLSPDVLLASPPCQTFSVASMSHHWLKSGVPKTQAAKDALVLVKNIMSEIKRLKAQKWLMENPRGMLRKLIQDPTTTITLCQYGDFRQKPTDLWGTIDLGWKRCSPSDSCHEPAPRGAHTGTQRIRSPETRASMKVLSKPILEAVTSESQSGGRL